MGPVAPFAGFFGRAREAAAIKRNIDAGKSTLLIGGKQAGKTALARHIAAHFQPTYYLDFAAWSPQSEAEVLAGIAQTLGGAARTREELQRLLLARTPAVMIIDNLGRILGQGWCGSFLAWLRFLDDTLLRTRIRFVLVGAPALWRYRNPADRGSPVLNTQTPLFLEPLGDAECRAWIRSAGVDLDVDAALHETGGHPWLLGELLWRVHDHGQTAEQALDDIIAGAENVFEDWRTSLGERGVELLAAIPRQGLPGAEFSRRGAMFARFRSQWPIVKCSCLVRIVGDRVMPGPQLFLDWLQGERKSG